MEISVQNTPYTARVCEVFDAVVISDMTEDAISTEENPSWYPVYYIGWREELGAGLVGGVMTGPFTSLNLLEDFCHRNWDNFVMLANAQEVDPSINLYDDVAAWK